MLSRLPLEVGSVTSNPDRVLVEHVNSGGGETLSDPSRRQDPKTVEHKDSRETCSPIKRPDSDASLQYE